MDPAQVEAEERKQEKYLRWADRSGWVLVAGLVIEFAYVLFSGKPLPEVVVTLVSDGLIIGGVAGELQFARWSKKSGDKLSGDAKEKLTEALTRAAHADEELARLKAQRALTPQQQAELETALRTPDRMNVNIVKFGDEPEIGRLFSQLVTVFTRAGWAISLQIAPLGASVEGVLVLAPAAPMNSDRPARALVEALNTAGIAAARRPLIGPYPQGSKREPSQTDASPHIRVDVGHKPP